LSDNYQTTIPPSASERVVEAYPSGRKHRAEYWLGDERVGVRSFFESGEPELEYALRDGKKHGMEYTWRAPGQLVSAEPYEDGLPHGTARQWSPGGRLVGTYAMVHGTGIDLWWAESSGGTYYLAEVFHLKDGLLDGFEWRLLPDQLGIYLERHWQGGQEHGIERQWTPDGQLAQGFPRFWLHGLEVNEEAYHQARAREPALPPWREEDNLPRRTWPPEIARELGPR
jgi:hypothetical protein